MDHSGRPPAERRGACASGERAAQAAGQCAYLPPAVHMFRREGLNLAFDAGSGTLLALDEAAWRALEDILAEGGGAHRAGAPPGEDGDALLPHAAHAAGTGETRAAASAERTHHARREAVPVARVREARREVEELVRNGLLLGRVAVPATIPPVLKALCLNVAHACQMRCAYCFASGGGYGGNADLMPREVARAAVDLLLDPSTGIRRWAIDFFGGEPLLNWPVVADTVLYARERAGQLGGQVHFTLTTNGLELTPDRLAFLDRHGVDLVVSLDGRPEVHDAMRRLVDGGPTWERALEGALRAASSRGGKGGGAGGAGPTLWVRGTFTRRNLDFARDAIFLFGLGVGMVSLEPVCGGPPELALGPDDLPALAEQYGMLARWCAGRARAGRPVRFYHFELDPRGGPCLSRRLAACGAGTEYLAVTPAGELYACHQLVGAEEFLAGDVYRGITRTEVAARMQEHQVARMEPCRACWARFLCGGACRAAAYFQHRGLGRPATLECELQKIRWEWALWLRASVCANA